jgi:hypothetical protein
MEREQVGDINVKRVGEAGQPGESVVVVALLDAGQGARRDARQSRERFLRLTLSGPQAADGLADGEAGRSLLHADSVKQTDEAMPRRVTARSTCKNLPILFLYESPRA